jgi:hypothetical protein
MIAKILTLGLGAIFLLAGWLFGVVEPRQALADATRAERLQPVSVRVLDDSPAGREALLEGRVSEHNRRRMREFVAYIRYEYRGDDEQWFEDEHVTPPLLELPDGRAQLAADYQLGGALASCQADDALVWNGWTEEGTKRYSGLVATMAVMALGTVAAGSEGRYLPPN